jgi:hypothetical protein
MFGEREIWRHSGQAVDGGKPRASCGMMSERPPLSISDLLPNSSNILALLDFGKKG